MRRTLAIAAFWIALSGTGFALGSVPSASAASLSEVESIAIAQRAAAAIDVWDIVTATELADQLEKGAPDGPDSQMVRALVRFHQGRYAEAVKLLDLLRAKGHKENETTRLIRETALQTKDFVEKKGAHFTIRYRPGPDAMLVDWALETLEAQRASLEQDLGYAPPENVPVEIYPDADKFASVTTLTRQEIETTGTIALCKFNKLMVTTPGALSAGYPWRDTLAHEYTHYVIARSTSNAVPIWLHEGLAKYEEVRWRKAAGGEKSPTTDTVLAEAIGAKPMIWVPLQKMHPSIAKLPSAFEATLAFAEVENLIGFCVENWKYDGVRALLHGLRDRKPMDVALLEAFGVGLEGLEAKWKEPLLANPPKAHPDLKIMAVALKDPKADADASGASHKGLSDEAGDHLHLGDLLAGEVRLDAAVIEYRKAREAERSANTGHGPIFDYKIASVWILANRWSDARKALFPVIETYPTYAPALKAMGRVELADGDPKRAKELLEKSLWLAPFDPEVYEMLAHACEKSGDEAGAKQWDARFKTFLRLASRETPAAQKVTQ